MVQSNRDKESPMPTDPLKRITQLYHFTDRRNLRLIRKHGGLYPMSKLKKKGIAVPAPGGNQWSQDADGLKGMADYVHLCFRPNHPMEFRARADGRTEDSIFLEIHPDVMYWKGVRFTSDVSKIQKRLRRAEKYEILVPAKIGLDLIRNLRRNG